MSAYRSFVGILKIRLLIIFCCTHKYQKLKDLFSVTVFLGHDIFVMKIFGFNFTTLIFINVMTAWRCLAY